MWCEGGAGVWSPPALETAGSLKCTTAQLHINFDCQFVACAGRCFELPLKMKANLVHSVSTADRCCCLFALGTIKGCQTIIYSIDLNHAGLSIMYNLSNNTPKTPPLLNSILIYLFFSPSVCIWVWSMFHPAKVSLCCVQQLSKSNTLIFSASCGENPIT